MPSSNARALEKARTIPCDGLILDLEDAVAPDAKPAARAAACAAAASGEYGRRTLTIRVNSIGTEWHDDDLAAVAEAGAAAAVAPKGHGAPGGHRPGRARQRGAAPAPTPPCAPVHDRRPHLAPPAPPP